MEFAGFIKEGMATDSNEYRVKLAPGSQVREEDFGLLFYTQQGPALYFVSSGDLLGEDFFQGRSHPGRMATATFPFRSLVRDSVIGVEKDAGRLNTKRGHPCLLIWPEEVFEPRSM